MFTGIIQTIGTIQALHRRGPEMTLVIDPGGLDRGAIRIGDSVSVNGACLTVVSLTDKQLHFDVSAETLSRSTFARLSEGAKVNLELALLSSDRLGGHIVAGHVDGLGELTERKQVGRSVKMRFRVPAALSRLIAEKGSISVDGVSLTVNTVEGPAFEVNIVPHTLHETTFGAFSVGQRVHIEVDLIARYVERLMSAEDTPADNTLDKAFLAQHGFAGSDDEE